MPGAEEEIYSTMFRSMKHPARRKILRMIANKPLTFSQLQDELGISSSYLTYHLENLGELISKEENGIYKLSAFGQATINTMKTVEETPSPKKEKYPLRKWKRAVAALTIALILVSSFAAVEIGAYLKASNDSEAWQSKYEQLISVSTNSEKALTFIDQVVQIDTSKYETSLLSRSVEHRDNLGGALEEILSYSLVNSESKMEVIFRFRNSQLSQYRLVIIEGAPIYAGLQPSSPLEEAKGLLSRFQAYQNAPYLQNMIDMLDMMVNSVQNVELTHGNLKLNTTSLGDATQFVWIYTENGVDFDPKMFDIVFYDRALTDLIDDMFLFSIGGTTINISADQAVTIARDALEEYSWIADGQTISDFGVVEPPVVKFHPNTRDTLALYPYWAVTFKLDTVYPGNVDQLIVGVYADTGDIGRIKTSY
ncbi:MAG: winged helix-turn-helix domain-containing protein [Candidatus Bathyarchaeota archaeon]|nr:winged helix-turn-helix domain-containing protein [Candidatus Bathyarchaeota archaeon]